MAIDNHQAPQRQAIINLITGFFGVLGAILILPRALRFFGKRFAFGIVSEIVAIVITGLLTEKLVSTLSPDGEDSPSDRTRPERPTRAPY
jgi:Na+/H+ antiporter NhaC